MADPKLMSKLGKAKPLSAEDINKVFDARLVAFASLAAFEDSQHEIAHQMDQYKDPKTGQVIQCDAAIAIQKRLKEHEMTGASLSRAYTRSNFEVERTITLIRLQTCPTC